MKFFTLIALLFLTACVSSQKAWQYSSFTDKPEYPLNQAKAICNGYADSISQNAGTYKAKRYIECNSSGNTWGNGWSGNTQCRQKSNQWDELSVASKNIRAKKESYDKVYIACLAQHGWNAKIYQPRSKPRKRKLQRMIKCKKPDGTIMETEVNELTCKMAYKGSIVK